MTQTVNFVILKITQNGETIYKVLAEVPGYKWRINSGIVSIKQYNDMLVIEGYSGSQYECDLNNYGLSTITRPIYEQVKVAADKINAEVSMLENNIDVWKNEDINIINSN